MEGSSKQEERRRRCQYLLRNLRGALNDGEVAVWLDELAQEYRSMENQGDEYAASQLASLETKLKAQQNNNSLLKEELKRLKKSQAEMRANFEEELLKRERTHLQPQFIMEANEQEDKANETQTNRPSKCGVEILLDLSKPTTGSVEHELSSTISATRTKNRRAGGDTATTHSLIQKLRKELEDEQRAALNQELKALTSQLQCYQQHIFNLHAAVQEQRESATERLQKLGQTNTALKSANQSLTQRLYALTKEKESFQKFANDRNDEYLQLKLQFVSTKDKIATLQTKNVLLERKNARLQELLEEAQALSVRTELPQQIRKLSTILDKRITTVRRMEVDLFQKRNTTQNQSKIPREVFKNKTTTPRSITPPPLGRSRTNGAQRRRRPTRGRSRSRSFSSCPTDENGMLQKQQQQHDSPFTRSPKTNGSPSSGAITSGSSLSPTASGSTTQSSVSLPSSAWSAQLEHTPISPGQCSTTMRRTSVSVSPRRRSYASKQKRRSVSAPRYTLTQLAPHHFLVKPS